MVLRRDDAAGSLALPSTACGGVFEALRAGASGFLLKDARGEARGEELVHAARVVAAGE